VRLRLPIDAALPDSIVVEVPPNIAGSHLTISEQVLLRLIRNNAWYRPIFLSSGLSPRMLTWLRPYCRMEGLVYRVVPVPSPKTNIDVLRDNVLERYSYDGFADPGVRVDEQTQMMAYNYYPGFLELIMALQENGDSLAAASAMVTMQTELPVERTDPPDQMRSFIEELSGSLDNAGQKTR
jgi:hypothetical protein